MNNEARKVHGGQREGFEDDERLRERKPGERVGAGMKGTHNQNALRKWKDEVKQKREGREADCGEKEENEEEDWRRLAGQQQQQEHLGSRRAGGLAWCDHGNRCPWQPAALPIPSPGVRLEGVGRQMEEVKGV